jgi:hypothetical protein
VADSSEGLADYSGGPATDSHRLPYSSLVRIENDPRDTCRDGRLDQTPGAAVKRFEGVAIATIRPLAEKA